ncbi:MAG TPA: BrnT family toxin [Candidatus Cloacimonetes bacterium]|nr:BrnT family toxin [Candidatus Cloacimonadota bacterium]
MEFEWNNKKADRNKKKHDISFQESATVFGDPLAITFEDPDHSLTEQRSITFGITRLNRYIVVSHTKRSNKTREENI